MQEWVLRMTQRRRDAETQRRRTQDASILRWMMYAAHLFLAFPFPPSILHPLTTITHHRPSSLLTIQILESWINIIAPTVSYLARMKQTLVEWVKDRYRQRTEVEIEVSLVSCFFLFSLSSPVLTVLFALCSPLHFKLYFLLLLLFHQVAFGGVPVYTKGDELVSFLLLFFYISYWCC